MPALAEFAVRGFLPSLLMCEHGTIGLCIVAGLIVVQMLVCHGIVLFQMN